MGISVVWLFEYAVAWHELNQLWLAEEKHAREPTLSLKWCYLWTPPGCWDTGGASGTSSSPIPQETQQDSLPEVSRVWLLLPSASKERGTSDEANAEHGRQENRDWHKWENWNIRYPWSGTILVWLIVTHPNWSQMQTFTTSNSLMVEHHSLVAAKLKFLKRGATRQDRGFWHWDEHLSQEGTRRSNLLKHLRTNSIQPHTYRDNERRRRACRHLSVEVHLIFLDCTCRLMLWGQLIIFRLKIWPKCTLKSVLRGRLSVRETSLSLYRIFTKRWRLVTSSLRAISALERGENQNIHITLCTHSSVY